MAQSPSPEASPWYAPEDLTSTLPAHVGDYELQIDDVVFDFLPDRVRRFWQELLAVVGEEPEAMRQAVGIGHQPFEDVEDFEDPGGLSFDIWVVRIVGSPATSWLDEVAAQQLEWSDSDERAKFDVGWQVIAGRDVWSQVITPEAFAAMVSDLGDEYSDANDQVGLYLYPKGEVLFSVSIPFPYPEDAPTVAEILAELP